MEVLLCIFKSSFFYSVSQGITIRRKASLMPCWRLFFKKLLIFDWFCSIILIVADIVQWLVYQLPKLRMRVRFPLSAPFLMPTNRSTMRFVVLSTALKRRLFFICSLFWFFCFSLSCQTAYAVCIFLPEKSSAAATASATLACASFSK